MKRQTAIALLDALERLGPGIDEIDTLARQIDDPEERSVYLHKFADVIAIVGYDLEFYEHLPRLFPHKDMKSSFAGKPAKIEETAFRNGALQGAYLIVAALLMGLDCGPMSGFDNAGVDKAFFAGTSVRSNFLCNLGYGDASALKPRSPRFSFDEMATII